MFFLAETTSHRARPLRATRAVGIGGNFVAVEGTLLSILGVLVTESARACTLRFESAGTDNILILVVSILALHGALPLYVVSKSAMYILDVASKAVLYPLSVRF